MQQHPLLLPSLKEKDNTVAILDNIGTWKDTDALQLEHISRSLKVTTADAKYSDIDSIPSMWARPLLFEMALYDANHPMHECILGEWRGLLAMLALKERRNLPLVTEQIEIPAADDVEAPDFLRALRRLLPEHTLEANTTWDKLYLILFEGKPIGLTSPTTFLCTSVDYVGCISRVPWFDGQFLCDPISHLNQEEKAGVAGWLTHLHTEQIDPLTAPDPNLNPDLQGRIRFITGRLNELIHTFRDDLGGIPASQPAFSDTGLGMTLGLFGGMNNPITHKEFFTEKLFVIRQENAFLAHRTLLPRGSELTVKGNRVTPILPITKELLDSYTVKDLSQRITFERTDAGIRVNLRLPSSEDKQKEDFVISQEYVKKEDDIKALFEAREIVEIPNVPVLEIWPNFRAPNWQAYYTYFLKAAQDTFYAAPFCSGDTPVSQSFEDMKITKTSNFPEAMICRYRAPDSSNYEDAGILLISVPDILPEGERTWNVGIDFGTSGTTVYRNDLQDQQGNPQPIAFDDRLWQITDSRQLRTRVYEDFFSSRLEITPFFSLFREHLNSGSSSRREGTLEPLLDGRINFVEGYELARNVVSDLKWSPEAIDRVRTQTFLEQICLQCAAEGVASRVGEINWHFSYPLAFSEDDTEQFHHIWDRVVRKCRLATGLQQGNVVSQSEGIVTAKFFANRFGGFAGGAVCIDIGGETSDISIWQKNKLYWQTSLRFAGRHIFLDLLKQNPMFLENFGVTDGDIQLLQGVSESDDFYSQADTWINAWINNSTETLQDKLAIYGGNVQVARFIQFIAMGISGLLYYVGLILNHLSRNEGFERKMPNIYIGGNGARILHWLANGNFEPNSENSRHLKKIILAASDFDRDDIFRLEVTPYPKHEAAFGLVGEDRILGGAEGQYKILAGEVFMENNTAQEWTEIINAERFEIHLSPRNKLVQMENFIKAFNAGLGRVLGGSIYLDGESQNELIEDLRDKLLHLHLIDLTKRIIEPLFILELKQLLKLQTQQWTE